MKIMQTAKIPSGYLTVECTENEGHPGLRIGYEKDLDPQPQNHPVAEVSYREGEELLISFYKEGEDAPIFTKRGAVAHENVNRRPAPSGLWINTPIGRLLSETKGTEDAYPGVYISLCAEEMNVDQSELVLTVEYETERQEIWTILYQKGKDEPVHIMRYADGKDLA